MPRLKNNQRTQITLYLDKKTVELLTKMSRIYDDFNNNNYDRNHFIKEVINRGIKYYLSREYMKSDLDLKKLLATQFTKNNIEEPKEQPKPTKQQEDDIKEAKETLAHLLEDEK